MVAMIAVPAGRPSDVRVALVWVVAPGWSPTFHFPYGVTNALGRGREARGCLMHSRVHVHGNGETTMKT